MDEYVVKKVQEIKNKIRNCTHEELYNIVIEEGEFGMSGINGKNKYTIPSEFYDDIKRALDEEKLLREVKYRGADDSLFEIVNNRRTVGDDVLENFIETDEQIKGKRELQRNARQARKKNEKRNIKKKTNKSKNKPKFDKAKEKKGKKIRTLVLAIGMTSVAAIGAMHGISEIQADAKAYNNTAATVEGLDENQIYNKAEEELKQKIANAIGVKPEDIRLVLEHLDSTTTVTKIKAGDKTFEWTEDKRGINTGNMSGKISKMISGLKNARDRKSAIRVLSEVENNDISFEDGKLTNEKSDDGEER